MKHLYSVMLLCLLLCCVCSARADEVTVWSGGICYSIDTETGCAAVSGAYDSIVTAGILREIENDGAVYPVTAIGDQAFYGKSALTQVTIPDSVTKIGSSVFGFCSALEQLTIPDSVTEIGSSVFNYCTALKEIDLGSGVTTIGEYCFALSGLTEITIPDSVTELGQSAFLRCASLKKAVLGDGITVLKYGAFRECTYITDVTFPKYLQTIEDYCFLDCLWIGRFELPATVTSIASWALQDGFRRVTTEIYCPKGCYAEQWAKEHSITVYYTDDSDASGTYDDITWTLRDGVLTISGSGAISEAPWVSYGQHIRQVVIQEGITAFGCYLDLPAITELTVPASVTYIESNSFVGCSSLLEFKVASGSRSFSAKDGVLFNRAQTALISCPRGKTGAYSIPSTVERLEDMAFFECSGLTEITIPDSVTSIGDQAFQYCSGLASVYVPDSVTEFENIIFADCWALQTVRLPAGLTAVTNGMFQHCFALREIDIPETVRYIDSWAFSECTSLKSIVLPESVRYFESGAFYRCTSLESVNIPATQPGIPYSAFYQCSSLKSITIPDSVTRIEDQAFQECYGLETIVIPDSVTYIGYEAFYLGNVESLTIGKGVTEIANWGIVVSTLRQLTVKARNAVLGDDWLHVCMGDSVPAVSCYEGSAVEAWAAAKGYPVTCIVCAHTVVTDEAVPATCVETGLTEGSHCSECGEIFTAQEVIPATGHTAVVDEAVPATCTTDGLTEGSHCAVCNETLTAQEVIPATGHTVIIAEPLPPTCVTVGLTGGSCCRVCGEVFKEQKTIPATHIHHCTDGVCGTCGQSFDWYGMTVLELPEDTEQIGESAFAGTAAEVIIVPDGCASVGSQAFTGCPNLKYLVLPAALEESIPEDAWGTEPQPEILFVQ